MLVLILCVLSCNDPGSNNKSRDSRQEAYTVIEKQEVTLTYLVDDNNLEYDRIDGMILLDELPRLKVYCTVTNTSDYGGNFVFYATLSSQGNQIEFRDEEYIGSGEKVTFSQEKEINHYSFESNVKVVDWGIIAPTKTVDVEVTKYRTVYD